MIHWTTAYGECSTPFGITDYIGAVSAVVSAVVSACSTPFGITDYIGISFPCVFSFRSRNRCSTPFGITDYIGWPWRAAPFGHFRCSTPFGITDYIGSGAGSQALRRWEVFNAFRHHGLYRTSVFG